MIRFKLEDENSENEDYVKCNIELNFKDGMEFDEWCDNSEFEKFMDQMECGSEPWCGVHDGSGGEDDDGIEYVSYSSYEIQDFDTATEKWREFFKSQGVLELHII